MFAAFLDFLVAMTAMVFAAVCFCVALAVRGFVLGIGMFIGAYLVWSFIQ